MKPGEEPQTHLSIKVGGRVHGHRLKERYPVHENFSRAAFVVPQVTKLAERSDADRHAAFHELT